MPDAAARYLWLADAGRNEAWRYGAGLAIVVFFFEVVGFAPYWLAREWTPFTPAWEFVALNLGVLCGFAGLAIAVTGLHRRRLLTLVTPQPRIDWRRILTGAAVWALFAALSSALEALLYPGRYRWTFNPELYFVYALLALALTPLQTTTEELIFRGYLMQALGRIARRPAVIVVASALVFTLPHAANPEVAQAPWLVLPQYFIIGALLGAVTLKDGRLELALGIHAANNLFTGLICNVELSVLATEALFTARFDPAYALAALAVSSVATWLVLFRGR